MSSTVMDGALYSTAADRTNIGSHIGVSLLRSNLDGSEPQAIYHWQDVKDGPKNFFVFNHELFFNAGDGGNDRFLWKTNGSAAGTAEVFQSGTAEYRPFDHSTFVVVNGHLTFQATTDLFRNGDFNGQERDVWVTDGTVGGTSDLFNPQHADVVNESDVVYTANAVIITGSVHGIYPGRYESDGTVDGVVQISANIEQTTPIDASLANDVLTVNGNSFDDNIVVQGQEDAVLVTVNGKTQAFRGVAELVINGNGGDDAITLDDVMTPDTINCGDGNDTIQSNDSFPGQINAGGGVNVVNGVIDDESGSDSTGDGSTGDNGSSDSGNGGQTASGGSSATSIVATPTFYTLSNGVLRINAPGRQNTIRLVGSAGSIKMIVDGQSAKVSLANVHSIIIRGGSMSDQILLQNLAIPSRIYGFGGNDFITASAGKDSIYGGDGNDVINGGDNHDTIYGEAGNDSLVGGAGRDYLIAGAGTDTLRGGASVDHLIFSVGDDTLNNAGDKLTIDALLG